MPSTFHFDLVSPEKLAFSGDVDQVDVPGIEVISACSPACAGRGRGPAGHPDGDVGRHAAEDHRARRPCEVSDKGLTVLADVATSMQDVDKAAFADKIAGMEEKLAEKEGLRASTARSSGSTTSRASSTSSTRRRCTRALLLGELLFHAGNLVGERGLVDILHRRSRHRRAR